MTTGFFGDREMHGRQYHGDRISNRERPRFGDREMSSFDDDHETHSPRPSCHLYPRAQGWGERVLNREFSSGEGTKGENRLWRGMSWWDMDVGLGSKRVRKGGGHEWGKL